MKKKILVMLIGTVLTLFLVGCNSKVEKAFKKNGFKEIQSISSFCKTYENLDVGMHAMYCENGGTYITTNFYGDASAAASTLSELLYALYPEEIGDHLILYPMEEGTREVGDYTFKQTIDLERMEYGVGIEPINN